MDISETVTQSERNGDHREKKTKKKPGSVMVGTRKCSEEKAIYESSRPLMAHRVVLYTIAFC